MAENEDERNDPAMEEEQPDSQEQQNDSIGANGDGETNGDRNTASSSNAAAAAGSEEPTTGSDAVASRNGGGGEARASDSGLRSLFVGNLYMNATQQQVEEVFTKPILPTYAPMKVDRVDLKKGFGFVFIRDIVTPEDAQRLQSFVSDISEMEVEGLTRAIRVEFARGDGHVKRKEGERRKNMTPSETLFVVNYHVDTTKKEDLQMLFEPFGELVRIEMKKNFAFVQFRTIEQATEAKNATNGGKLDQSHLTVEFTAKGGGGGGGRDSRDYDRRRDGGGRDRVRHDDRRRDGGGRGRFDDDRGRFRNDDRERPGGNDFRGRFRDDPYDDRRRGPPPPPRARPPPPPGPGRYEYNGGPPMGGGGGGRRIPPPLYGDNSPPRGGGYRPRGSSRSRSPPRFGGGGPGGGYRNSPPRGGPRYEDDRDRLRYERDDRDRRDSFRAGAAGAGDRGYR